MEPTAEVEVLRRGAAHRYKVLSCYLTPIRDEVPVLAAVSNLASPGCCRDSDTARTYCCFSE